MMGFRVVKPLNAAIRDKGVPTGTLAAIVPLQAAAGAAGAVFGTTAVTEPAALRENDATTLLVEGAVPL